MGPGSTWSVRVRPPSPAPLTVQHALYTAWMEEALGGPLPGAPRSTCGSCAMCPTPQRGPGTAFRPDVKCCMFTPRLPNFLVGGLIRAQGEGWLAARRDDLRPWGVERAPARSEALHLANAAGRFGQEPALVCPHYAADSGLCGIWTHRDAVCSTWYCKPDRGRVGKALWNDVYRLLVAVEELLARDCCAAMGVEPHGGFGPWSPRDLYLACEARVRDMRWREVMARGGFELRFRLRDVRASLRALGEHTLPQALRWAPQAVHPLPGGGARVEGYGPYDPLDLDAALLASAQRFDGRPTPEVLADLDGPLPEGALLALVDHGVLRPAEDLGSR